MRKQFKLDQMYLNQLGGSTWFREDGNWDLVHLNISQVKKGWIYTWVMELAATFEEQSSRKKMTIELKQEPLNPLQKELFQWLREEQAQRWGRRAPFLPF